ncbi:MAG: helix-turn-helix domain-containing protein [Anaerolineae bacterium]|nr:helix-turn-helix domain-containing protein [Anaerolineae bacterium]
MSRSLKVRKPTSREMRWLEVALEGEIPTQVQRRTHALLYHGLGLAGVAIAAALQVHRNTIYADLKAFAHQGLASVRLLPKGGAPARITAAQLNAIGQWAKSSPHACGLLDARWTLESFREFLVKRQHLLKRISLEHLRRLLKKRISAFGASNANSSARIRNALRF